VKNYKLPKVPENVSAIFNDICSVMAALCKEKLSDEYFHLGVELATKIARKRVSPFLSGYTKTWAAGIIHAIGFANFLFDKSQPVHLTSKELCEWFDLGQSTISVKSKSIRKMFKIHQMDPKWCLPSKVLDNPYVWLIAFDGCIVDVRNAPYEMQLAAYEAGVIPFIPDQK